MLNWLQRGFCTLLLLFATPILSTEMKKQSTVAQKEKTFINYMAKRYHFKREKLVAALSQAKYDEEVIFHITHPYEEKLWYVYRHYFITEKRIQNGINYWKVHARALEYAKRRYGVPPAVIVAIIGIETNYKERIGKYSALNALTTLAFHYNHRTKFFTRELAQFFLLIEEQRLPLPLLRSSYAGAIGIPQFMPSTYRHYAVTYTKQSHIDLMNNDEDAIVSIANFLHTHGWHKNQPIACAFSSKKPLNPQLISKRTIPKISIKQLKNKGIIPSIPIPDTKKVAIIQLKMENSHEKWLVFANFSVIMRYNPCIIYAMAVYQLSQALQKRYDQQTPGTRNSTTPTRKPQKRS
ncbi:lytic murein transglycosylase B [Coxiella endosymbiont of Ornithodoros maritimus]|uniref:lytic murein transglycosylase B n=1 Tax=Coxiella endosymbiont of Ornithodoros maritimus TaxID=1656172 RepID=UPI002264AD70|nr:lytic murein transglycosylase B [Coxiella endosymbiont of Ornithodoros maritimus]